MNAKDYLSLIRLLDHKISIMERHKAELEGMLTDTGGIDYAKPKVISSNQSDIYSDRVIRLVDYSEQINKTIDEYIDLKQEAIRLLMQISDKRYLDILFEHYLNFRPLSKIAKDLHYSTASIYRLHGKALIEFEKIMRNNEKE